MQLEATAGYDTWNRHYLSSAHFAAAAVSFSLLMIYGSIIPGNFSTHAYSSLGALFWAALDSKSLVFSKGDFLVNLTAFAAISYLWMGVFSKKLSSLAAAICCMLIAFLLSVICESAQLLLPTRIASIYDVYAHLSGAACGIVLWSILGRKVNWLFFRYWRKTTLNNRLNFFLHLYALWFLAQSFMPFDPILSPAAIYHKFKGGMILLTPFSGPQWQTISVSTLFFDALVYVPLGALCISLFAAETKSFRRIVKGAAAGFLVAFGVEFMQIFIKGRFADATDVLTGCAGIVAGCLLTTAFIDPRNEGLSLRASMEIPAGWLVALTLYAFLAAVYFIFPLNFIYDEALIKQNLSGFLILPFYNLQSGPSFYGLQNALEKVAIFFPLGLLAAKFIRTIRLSPPAEKFLIIIALMLMFVEGTGIELMQTALLNHLSDITDTLLYWAGFALGMVFGLGFITLPEKLPLSAANRNEPYRHARLAA